MKSVDPLATSNENVNYSEAESDANDNGFDMNETRSDSDNEDGNFDSSHLPRSEEIIVVSNVKIVPILGGFAL